MSTQPTSKRTLASALLVGLSLAGASGCAVDATNNDEVASSPSLANEETFREMSALVPEERPGEIAISTIDVDAPEEDDDVILPENSEDVVVSAKHDDVASADPTSEEGNVRSVEQNLFNDCNKVDIRVTNNRKRYNSAGVLVGTDIKVRYVRYWDDTSDKWREEGLTNKNVESNSSEWWENQKLEYSDGHRLTKWHVYYSYREADGDWSDTVYQDAEFYGRWSDSACTTNNAWYKITVN